MNGIGTVRLIRSTGLAGLVVGVSSLAAAFAQSNGGSQDLTRGLTDPKNGGVAGTGMGTTDKRSTGQSGGVGSGGATGTGMSVKGPAGQGITSRTGGVSDADTPSGAKPIGQ